MGAAARREPGLHERAPCARRKHHRPEARWLRGAFWRNFQVKYREINDLHKQMLRTSAKVDAMPAGAERERGARPPLPGPVERLLLARPVRRHLHQPHAARDVRAPHRGRGPRRPGGRPRSRPPSAATSTSTGSTTSGWPAPGQVVDDRPDRGRRHRRLGHPGRPARPVRRHAPPARGVPRDAPRARGRGGPAGRRRGRRPTATAPASIHELVMTKEPGLAAAPLRPVRAALRAGPLPAARHRAAGLGDRHRRRARRRGRGRLRGRLARGRPARRRPRRDGDERGGAGGSPRDQADRDRRRSPVPQPAPRGHGREPIRRSGSTRGSASSGR